MEKGLYKNESGTLLFAEVEVTAPDDYLSAANKEEGYGWKWFASREEALEYYGITEEQHPDHQQ